MNGTSPTLKKWKDGSAIAPAVSIQRLPPTFLNIEKCEPMSGVAVIGIMIVVVIGERFIKGMHVAEIGVVNLDLSRVKIRHIEVSLAIVLPDRGSL